MATSHVLFTEFPDFSLQKRVLYLHDRGYQYFVPAVAKGDTPGLISNKRENYEFVFESSGKYTDFRIPLWGKLQWENAKNCKK